MADPGSDDLAGLLAAAEHIARCAAGAILEVYQADFEVRGKADASPVTAADERAEALIVPALRALTPALPVVAEEAAAAGRAPKVGERFWLVDPLDGTREFQTRNGEFTVNIALVEQGRPVLGAIDAPALQVAYAGGVELGAWRIDGAGRTPIACRVAPRDGIAVLASRSHGDSQSLEQVLRGRAVAEMRPMGSSLKFCLIAAGEADCYARFGRTMEWDTAAGHAILNAAGGEIRRAADAQLLRYGKPGFENPDFVACGRA
jgi:3'(2'), 5'-bisphosphate nucleotidase